MSRKQSVFKHGKVPFEIMTGMQNGNQIDVIWHCLFCDEASINQNCFKQIASPYGGHKFLKTCEKLWAAVGSPKAAEFLADFIKGAIENTGRQKTVGLNSGIGIDSVQQIGPEPGNRKLPGNQWNGAHSRT